jgi:Mg2+/Co2+ transporter CorC
MTTATRKTKIPQDDAEYFADVIGRLLGETIPPSKHSLEGLIEVIRDSGHQFVAALQRPKGLEPFELNQLGTFVMDHFGHICATGEYNKTLAVQLQAAAWPLIHTL